jgi:hypothetical protein
MTILHRLVVGLLVASIVALTGLSLWRAFGSPPPTVVPIVFVCDRDAAEPHCTQAP